MNAQPSSLYTLQSGQLLCLWLVPGHTIFLAEGSGHLRLPAEGAIGRTLLPDQHLGAESTWFTGSTGIYEFRAHSQSRIILIAPAPGWLQLSLSRIIATRMRWLAMVSEKSHRARHSGENSSDSASIK
jgi:hypothetical protein